MNRTIHGKFDAVICLGNCFTHLFSERDGRKPLAEFYAALRHDGALTLDQRNYDAILDRDFSTKRKYYYRGDNISAELEHVDEGLAGFKYSFPDSSVFHLSVCPVRKEYTRTLLHEIGFQRIEAYGDFQDIYQEHRPDFFIHVASKYCIKGPNRRSLDHGCQTLERGR